MRHKLLFVILVIVSLFAAACGGQQQEATEDAAPTAAAAVEEAVEQAQETAPEVEEAVEQPMDDTVHSGSVMLPSPDPLAVSGDIVTAGSSTVFPLAERMAERYQNEGYFGQITVDSIGSGAGYERFCVAGETDVANASRGIREEEIANCEAIGRTPIEFRVGTDALAVVVSNDNDFVEDVTLEELNLLFSTAETWADVRPEWPAEPIQRFIPGTDSGTFDYFTEEIFDEDAVPQLEASNLQQSEDDNVLVQGVSGSPYAIGYFGFAYAAENTDLLHTIAVEGVEANAASVDAGDYPLARPLFIYSDATIMNEKPQVADYINFFLTFVNEEVIDVGYFPASDEALNASRTAWLVAMGLAEGEAMEEDMTEDAGEEMAMGVMPSPDPLAVSGDVVTAGSSTVFPLAERLAERYQNEGFAGQITVDSIGSGAGYERFCVAGETDVANASRGIREEEIANCEAIGRTPIEFRVGTDALAVVVSNDNDFVEDVTLEELNVIFSTAETWADVRPEWPAEPIQRFIPGTDSGTFDYFTEELFDEDAVPQLEASNLQQSEDDNVLVQGVSGSPYAIGYFGYAYAAENTDLVHTINIEGVEANAANVDAGDYPLARPLFIYGDATIMNEKPQVADYINFFLTYVNEEVIDVGYFPASDEALESSRMKWMVAMGLAEADAMMDDSAAEGATGGICELPTPDPLAVSGDVVTAGSSTVFPLAERMAERFQNEGFAGQITVDSIGSGAGYERFCVAGETDVANASRGIREEEIANCEAIGRTPIEFRVGTDALAVVVSNDNDFVEDVTLEELNVIFSTAETWADVRPEWPAEPIQRFIPGTDSGTFDYFTEELFDEDAVPQLEASNLQQSEDDNVLVQGVSGSPYAIGYFGYAYAAENTDLVHTINIEGVEANAANVDAGDYPLARPLFIYGDATIMNEKPQVADYINFFLTYVNEEVIDVGYFPASDKALNSARCDWTDAMGQ